MQMIPLYTPQVFGNLVTCWAGDDTGDLVMVVVFLNEAFSRPLASLAYLRIRPHLEV
jgi:hypothetical protein